MIRLVATKPWHYSLHSVKESQWRVTVTESTGFGVSSHRDQPTLTIAVRPTAPPTRCWVTAAGYLLDHT
jgi:hypothetical protein